MTKLHLQPSDGPLGPRLVTALREVRFDRFRAAVAFVKRSGVRQLDAPLRAFADRGGRVEFLFGVDHLGTSYEGLQDLLDAVGPAGEVRIHHNEHAFVTFHPKLYLFEGPQHALLIAGSTNLTEGGLFTNTEAFVVSEVDKATADANALQMLAQANSALDACGDLASLLVRRLDQPLLNDLLAGGYVKREAQLAVQHAAGRRGRARGRTTPALFGVSVPHRPARPAVHPSPSASSPQPRPTSARTARSSTEGYVMTLHQTDVGIGQVNPGKQRRANEIFIPLDARNEQPNFWGWPTSFTHAPTPKDPNQKARAVTILLGSQPLRVMMMASGRKHDLRLRKKELRAAGNVGDLLVIRTSVTPGIDYEAETISPTDPRFKAYDALASTPVKSANSQKRYGYF